MSMVSIWQKRHLQPTLFVRRLSKIDTTRLMDCPARVFYSLLLALRTVCMEVDHPLPPVDLDQVYFVCFALLQQVVSRQGQQV